MVEHFPRAPVRKPRRSLVWSPRVPSVGGCGPSRRSGRRPPERPKCPKPESTGWKGCPSWFTSH